jgi:hypothetical protein
MRQSLALLAFASAMLALAPARSAAARDRMAVLIACRADQRLGDNLTEVAIAQAAEATGDELVGTRELRQRLAQMGKSADLAACAEDLGCVAEVARAMRAARVVVGTVSLSPERSQVRLALVDAASATETAALEREVANDVHAVIEAVQSGVHRLLAAPAPVAAGSSQTAARAQVAAQLAPASGSDSSVVPPSDRTDARRSRWPSLVAYGAAGLALVSVATAIVTGVIGTGDLTGSTRLEAEQDLARRQHYASIANGCWIAAGALSITSAVAFVWRW